MSNNDYQDLPAISSHWLIAMLDSPAACWRKYLDPQRPTEKATTALRLGTLVHCLALTPRQFEREFIVADCERHSNTGKQAYAELTATGLTVARRTRQGPRHRRRPGSQPGNPQVATPRQEGADDHSAQGARIAPAQGPAGYPPRKPAASHRT